MVTVRAWIFPFVIALTTFTTASGQLDTAPRTRPRSHSLFAQSASTTLSLKFPSADVSYLLLDTETGDIIASRWVEPGKPIPMGSLVKPFLALAYGQQHEFRFPTHTCRGTATGCWLPRGHGHVSLDSAIAGSCNSYFRVLATGLHAADVSPTAAQFGLQSPPPDSSGPALLGLGSGWLISPLQMAHGYLELLRRRDQPGAREILDGMARSARQGTASEVDRALASQDGIAKTGTAACTHAAHAPGDGFTVALFPADRPQVLLMVRVHGVPGAQAAKTAGRMLREIQR